ncbi:hypothetical protein PC116_g34218 [Phytophthora cactorum]|nr:hypothetical protein PC116_g34218 [Phytophthora cactorum]
MPPRQSSRLKKAIADTAASVSTPTNGTSKSKVANLKAEVRATEEDIKDDTPSVTEDTKSSKKRKADKIEDEEEDDNEAGPVAEKPKAGKKRKTAKEKTEDLMALAKRTIISTLKRSMYIGAHVSSAGGL